ncbi:MAG: adenylyltransferase/cytidyltransferase family protein [Candidatus Buchananbacteria bacterium]|nr:adenylyltransferase/cytidyltransferase family protein [Candidatus Buchananbacteria bacterium]
MNKLVMVFGTFSVIHPGHLNLFKQAKKYGGRLAVVVARDKVSQKIKGRKPINTENDRLELVRSLKIVDQAVLGDRIDPMKNIKKFKPDVVCLGYDQVAFVDILKKTFPDQKIIRLKPYKEKHYKSSKLM